MSTRRLAPVDPYAPVLTAFGAEDPRADAGADRVSSSGGVTLAALPSVSQPRLLFPVASPRAAQRSLRQYTDNTRRIERVGAEALGLLIRLGLGELLVRGRVAFRAECAEGFVDGAASIPLIDHLCTILGERDLAVAVRLGPLRPNRKPVLQLLTGDGTVVAYVKVGWEPLTRSLVRREAAALRLLAAATGGHPLVRVPRLVHAGSWGDLELVVVAPVGIQRFSLRGRVREVPMAATSAVADLFGRTTATLASTTYWARMQRRAAAVDLDDLVDAMTDRWGGRELDLGLCHGDWLPSNMTSHGPSVCVWDWERMEGATPIGVDLAHFTGQVTAGAAGSPAAVREVRDRLPELRVDPSAAELLVSLDLFEMTLRFSEARTAGLPVPDDRYEPALRAVLAR